VSLREPTKLDQFGLGRLQSKAELTQPTGAVHPSDEGTPQGGSISVLLSNLYLHHVLDLWFERVVKCRLRGEARLCAISMTL